MQSTKQTLSFCDNMPRQSAKVQKKIVLGKKIFFKIFIFTHFCMFDAKLNMHKQSCLIRYGLKNECMFVDVGEQGFSNINRPIVIWRYYLFGYLALVFHFFIKKG